MMILLWKMVITRITDDYGYDKIFIRDPWSWYNTFPKIFYLHFHSKLLIIVHKFSQRKREEEKKGRIRAERIEGDPIYERTTSRVLLTLH